MAPGALGQEHYFFILSPLHSDEHRPDLSTMIGNGIDHLKLFELHPTIYLQDHEHVKTKVQTTVSTDSPPKKGEGSFHFASVEEMEHLFSFDVEGMKTMVDSDLDDLTPKAHLIIMENDQIARLCHDLLTHLSGSRIMAPMVLGLGMSIGIVGSNAKPRDVASMVCLLTCEKKGR
jgi:hypothetical protein